jgi:hypothetical protein
MTKEMRGRCLLRLTRVYNSSKCQERSAKADHPLFITPLGAKWSLASFFCRRPTVEVFGSKTMGPTPSSRATWSRTFESSCFRPMALYTSASARDDALGPSAPQRLTWNKKVPEPKIASQTRSMPFVGPSVGSDDRSQTSVHTLLCKPTREQPV